MQMNNTFYDIRIGTLVSANKDAVSYINQIKHLGWESLSLTFWGSTEGTDLDTLAREVKREIEGTDIIISSLSIFGNPLGDKNEDALTLKSWELLIDKAHLFNCEIISGFTGRVRDASIPDSMSQYKKVFGELAKRAENKSLKIAFENCPMGGDWEKGDWNIAHNPAAWEMMFNEVPSQAIGLEWEPCHQMVQLIDPMPQLRKWANRIYHVHGKDATVMWDVIREYGIVGDRQYSYHRTPGFGDSNWSDIITELRLQGFKGSIDIEGWHDPVYRDDLEMTGQVHALNYLKNCRGGMKFIPNPETDSK